MLVAAVLTIALTIAVWSDRCAPTVFAGQLEDPQQPTVVVAARVVNHRLSKELMQERNGPQMLETPAYHKTVGQKSSADDYRTLSSLQISQNPAVAVNDSQPVTVNDEVYPMLPTDPPPPPSYITRSRYARRPPYYSDGRDFSQDVEIVNDQQPEYSVGIANVAPKRNRYYQSNHRRLKKYSPTIVQEQETDVSQTDSGNGDNFGTLDKLANLAGEFNEYDNAVNYNTNTATYELEGLKAQNNDVEVSWYGNPHHQAMSPQPVAITATDIEQPNHITSFDMQKLGMLTIIKIGLAKLKVLKIIKFLTFLVVKLKMLIMWKAFMFIKLVLAIKFFKLFVFPFIPNMFSWIKNTAMTQMNQPSMNMMPMMSSSDIGQYRNDSTPELIHKRSADYDIDWTVRNGLPNLIHFMFAVQNSKCVEKLACRVAGTKPPNLNSIWMNWILSSLVNYIPNAKLKTYVLTFKVVSNYRLGNLFSNPSAEEWLKWCNERYSCRENLQ